MIPAYREAKRCRLQPGTVGESGDRTKYGYKIRREEYLLGEAVSEHTLERR